VSEPASRPLPQCKAILPCERSLIEAGTARVSLVGIIEDFAVADIPASLPAFVVFLQLTDGVGRYTITAEIHDLQDDVILARSPEIAIEWSERLTRANLFLNVPSFAVQHEGAYDLVAFANGREIDRQKLTVVHTDVP